MAEHGTTWEGFAPRVGEESFSHAWSAHPLYHLMQIIGGIRQGAAGWKCIIFQPHFVGQSADVSVPTPHGNIRSVWQREGSIIRARRSLPEGISATVQLPGAPSRKGRVNLSWSLNA